MPSGIVKYCRTIFDSGVHDVENVFIELNKRGIHFNPPSVRAIVSEMRKKAGLTSKRGRRATTSVEVERVFDSGKGLTTVAGILLHLQTIGLKHTPKSVRTLVQSLRKQHNISGELQDDAGSYRGDEP